MQQGKTKEVRQAKEQEPEKSLDSVWISCPYEEEVALSVEEALGAKARVYSGQHLPRAENPSAVLLCPSGADVVSEMKRIRALAPDAPVLVYCQKMEARLAEEALQAGASGFVHAGMPPERIALALSLAFEGEVLIPKGLLGELLGRRLFLRRPRLLDP
jgi:DNA-binding NarL/FixJ family response regulator